MKFRLFVQPYTDAGDVVEHVWNIYPLDIPGWRTILLIELTRVLKETLDACVEEVNRRRAQQPGELDEAADTKRG